MGKDFTVEVISAGDWEDDESWGSCDHKTSRILVKNLSQDVNTATFFHELVHAILNCMNHDLNNDETFVDVFGGLLHQALKSANYDPDL
jgi:hypothetical protein